MYKCSHSNPNIVQPIDTLSCLSDKKGSNERVMTKDQDGQEAVISKDQDGQDAVITHDQDGQDTVISHYQDGQDAVISHDQDGQYAVISIQDDDDPSRPIQKVQRILGSPRTKLLYTEGTSMAPQPTKSGVAITSSSNDQHIIHKFLNMVKSGYYLPWISQCIFSDD